jgi:hypothetical protein
MKIIEFQKKRSLFWNVKRILHAIAKEANFDNSKLKKLKKMFKVVFSGEEKNWTSQFKFDISFSISNKKFESIRFSCNNKGEGYNWIKKINHLFNLFQNFSIHRSIISQIEKKEISHLTVGVDWLHSEKEPRLKIYIESNNQKRVENFIKDVLKIKNFELGRFLLNGFSVCGLGINFLPNNETTFKIYLYADKRNLPGMFTKKLKMFTKKLNLDFLYENDSLFSLFGVGFSKTNKIISKKIYFIYETREFWNKLSSSSLLQRYEEIKNCLLNLTEKKFLDKKINLLSKKISNNFLIYPIGISINLFPKENFGSKNIYVSLFENNEES